MDRPRDCSGESQNKEQKNVNRIISDDEFECYNRSGGQQFLTNPRRRHTTSELGTGKRDKNRSQQVNKP